MAGLSRRALFPAAAGASLAVPEALRDIASATSRGGDGISLGLRDETPGESTEAMARNYIDEFRSMRRDGHFSMQAGEYAAGRRHPDLAALRSVSPSVSYQIEKARHLKRLEHVHWQNTVCRWVPGPARIALGIGDEPPPE